jgi:hypothetical protein
VPDRANRQRGGRDSAVGPELDETLSRDDKIARMLANLNAFLESVLA